MIDFDINVELIQLWFVVNWIRNESSREILDVELDSPMINFLDVYFDVQSIDGKKMKNFCSNY